ncbi:MAG TPA: hypothetical protein VGG36_05135 [Rhizomicrobium sp.]
MGKVEPAAPGRVETGPTASAGKIQVLDLAALKARIGSKWMRMAEPVEQFFEAAIKRNLGPGDAFYRSDELSYLVVFRGLSAEEAELKCAAISEEVCHRLFGKNGESVTMRNLIGSVRMGEQQLSAAEQQAVDRRLEREGREVLITKNAATNAQQQSAPAREMTVTLNDAKASQRRISSADIAFAYRPVWDCNKHAVLTYLAQPALASASARPGTDDFISANDPEDALFVDLLALEECATRVKLLREAAMRIILAVPVHFTTIARGRYWDAYSARYRLLAKNVARDLAFVISGIEKGVPHIRLVQELPKLSVNAFRVLCLLDHVEGSHTRFARSGTHGIGVALSRYAPEAQSVKLLSGIAREAQLAGVDSFALGIPSTSQALRAVDAGVRYLEGPIVRPAVMDPRHAFLHDVEDLYRTKRG